MSFGLLTALNPTDIPSILRRCAQGYRGNESQYPDAWKLAADEFDRFARELAPKIKSAMDNQRKPRPRL
jgi:hypothetical protein